MTPAKIPPRLLAFGGLILILGIMSLFLPRQDPDWKLRTPVTIVREGITPVAQSILQVGGAMAALTPAEERSLFRDIEHEFLAGQSAVKDPVLDEFLAKLLPHANLKGASATIKLLDWNFPNAFALPGGAIFVTSALKRDAPSPDALAMVIAHEIAHVEFRHGWEQVALASRGEKLLPGPLARICIGFLARGYSKTQEEQADSRALELVLSAGWDGHRAIRLFELFEKMGGSAIGSGPADIAEDIRATLRDYRQSHPYPKERRERLKRSL